MKSQQASVLLGSVTSEALFTHHRSPKKESTVINRLSPPTLSSRQEQASFFSTTSARRRWSHPLTMMVLTALFSGTSPFPTTHPSTAPSPSPTAHPSAAPSPFPTANPSPAPSPSPTASRAPIPFPSPFPTARPNSPSTPEPTSSMAPTAHPSAAPSPYPTAHPTAAPSSYPTARPSGEPTPLPSPFPTARPNSPPTPEPTSSMAPTAQFPTEEVGCPTCTLTSGIKSDPYFVAWGNNADALTGPSSDESYYPFPGSCDTIAFDTENLQLQVRTRPDGAWSGTVQVGLKWKPTGKTIFLFNGSQRMTVDNTSDMEFAGVLTYTKQTSSYFHIHWFHFLGGPAGKDNFMKIEEWMHGLHNIEIKGHGSTFGGSRGTLGAWNRYNDNTYSRFVLRNGNIYQGNDFFDVIESWKVRNAESVLDQPSSICTSSSDCGNGPGELACIWSGAYRARELRELQIQCDKTCDDLTTPIEKSMCNMDVALSGETHWACQSTYTDPIIYDSEMCPSSCKGDATTEQFPIANLFVGNRKKCEWAIRRPELKGKRCSRPEVALNCCASCCSECVGDAAGNDMFFIPEMGKRRSCDWAGRKAPKVRCAIDTVARMCCATCAPHFV